MVDTISRMRWGGQADTIDGGVLGDYGRLSEGYVSLRYQGSITHNNNVILRQAQDDSLL